MSFSRGSRFVKIAEGLGVDMLHRIGYRLLSDSDLPHIAPLLEMLLARLQGSSLSGSRLSSFIDCLRLRLLLTIDPQPDSLRAHSGCRRIYCMVNASEAIVTVGVGIRRHHFHPVQRQHALLNRIWLVKQSSSIGRLVMLALLRFEVLVQRHRILVTVPNDVSVVGNVSVFELNGRPLHLLIGHVLENGPEFLRRSSVDIYRSIVHAILSLVLVPFSWFLSVDRPDHSRVFWSNVG